MVTPHFDVVQFRGRTGDYLEHPPGTPSLLTWDNPLVTLANVTADGAGNFSEQVTCPPNAPLGVHQVTATGGGFTLAQPVFAIPPAPPPSTP